jgi:hypothetical protein
LDQIWITLIPREGGIFAVKVILGGWLSFMSVLWWGRGMLHCFLWSR